MYGKILVPIDGSETSMRGLEEAIKVAKALGAKIRVLHVVNELILDGGYSPGTYANDLFRSLREVGSGLLMQAEKLVRQHGVDVETEMLESIGAPAADFIVAQSRQWPADLIVMGTHGRRGLARFAMGSDAEFVVRAAAVPVLLVRNVGPHRGAGAEAPKPAAAVG